MDYNTMHYVSPSYTRIWGRSCESLYANPHSWMDAIHPHDRKRVESELKDGRGGRADIQYRIIRNDGEIRWIGARIEEIKDSLGNVRRLCGITLDFTDLKRAQIDVAQSELKYRRLFETAKEGILILDAETGEITEINPFMLEVLGHGALECLGKKLWDIGFPKDAQISKNLFNDLRSGGYARYDDLTLKRKDGRTVQVELVSNVYNVSGKSVIQCNIRDITERKKSESALRESESSYRVLFEGSTDGIAISDFDTKRFLRVNPAMCRMFGYSEEELSALGVPDIHPKETLPAIMADFKTLAGEKKPPACERPCLRKDGTIFYTDITAAKMMVAGQARCVRHFRDITERRLAERSLRRMADIIESSDESIIGASVEGVIVSWNRASERLFGYGAQEIIGKSVSLLCPPHLLAEQSQLIKDVRDGGRVLQHETRRVGKDGKIFDAQLSISPILGSGGELTGFAGFYRDIKQRKHLEAKLLQSQKMEGIGRLAGGIAHDFNNLLTAIMGYGQFLLEKLSPSEPMRGDVTEILKAGHRAAALTRQLLSFSRQQVIEPKILDLNAVIDNLRKMLHRIIGEDIELTFLPGDDLGCVKSDAGQIDQILMNLCINAKDAMPAGGKIIIETRAVGIGGKYDETHPTAKPGPYVMLAVSDTGTGMSAEVLSHIFEPFFTTKEQGKGTGLGLSTVYGIAQQNGGTIDVYSELGLGTTFKIYLPRAGEPVAPSNEGPKAPVSYRGAETILLVEDDESVRKFAARVIVEYGYAVLTAKSPSEAIRICEQNPQEIHLMLTDVVMPEMLGFELARRLAAIKPKMLVVFMSGYTEQSIIAHALASGAPFLQKPMTAEAIVSQIRKTLDAPERSPIRSLS